MGEAPRIVVTGLGVVCGLGCGVEEVWRRLLAGESAVQNKVPQGVEELGIFVSAPAPQLEISQNLPSTRPATLAWHTSRQALQDAGLESFNPQEILLSVALGWDFEAQTREASAVGLVDRALAKVLGIGGGIFSSLSACAASTMALGQAWQILRSGKAKIALAGGADSRLNPLGMLSYAKLSALAKGWGEEPHRASRPFDRTRNGFVVGEGAGFLVLETLDSAQARGARIYAELAGYSATNDAYRLTDPEPSGEQASRCMREALGKAGVSQPDAVNAHATSTQANDRAEYHALLKTFGDPLKDIPIMANKSSVGHLAMAAGAVESVFSVLSLHHQILPPNLNVEDLEFPLLLPKATQPRPLHSILKNSFGFGGQNASLVWKRVE